MDSIDSSEEDSYGYSAPPLANKDEEWSSDSDAGATAAGYSLLLNETDSEDEADAEPSEQDLFATSSIDAPDWRPFSAISPEEEARLRKEAFENFDRNYAAVRQG